MKRAKLILLENPIIVTDEEIVAGDMIFHNSHGKTQIKKCEDILGKSIIIDSGNSSCWVDYSKKIISTNKQIDYNGIDFGVVDVEKLAEDELQYNQFSLRQYDKEFKEFFIEGFKASQQLNEKKFSEDDLRNYRKMYQIELEKQANSFRKVDINSLKDFEILRENTHQEVMKQLSLPKTFEIEIEETETNIKIIKKL